LRGTIAPMTLFSPGVATCLDRIATDLLRFDPDALYLACEYFPVARNLEQFGHGAFVSELFDAPTFRAAIEAREPTVVAFGVALLHRVDPEAALKEAIDLLSLGVTDGDLDRRVRDNALLTFQFTMNRIPFDILIRLLNHGGLGENEAASLADRPELADGTLRFTHFEAVENAPANESTAARGLRFALARRGVAEKDPAMLARLAIIADTEGHPFRGHALDFTLDAASPEALLTRFDGPASLEERGKILWRLFTHHPALAAPTFGERLSTDAGRSVLGDEVIALVLRAATIAANAKRLPKDDASMIGAGVALLEVSAHRDLARALLSALDRKAVERAMGGSKKKAKKVLVPAPALPKKIDFLRRYQKGEHEAVWSELRALGPTVRDPALEAEAMAVARLTMTRMRDDLERIAATLKAGKYRTKLPVPVQREKPDNKAAQALEKIVGGPLPMSLRALYDTFRVIDLREHKDALVDTYTLEEELGRHDPLVVLSVKNVTTEAKQQAFVRKQQAASLREPFRVGLTPVDEGKYDPEGDYDGMVTWHAILPDTGFDVQVEDEKGKRAWLLDRLRAYVLAGGFSGPMDAATKQKLTAGLEPF
jgi:hypothetical protein